jgi:N4-gp56 family major capsid protein
MSQTTVPVGSPLARKVYGAALFAATQRQPTLMNRLTGAAPQQAQAEAKLKGQSSPDMPFVRVTDLSKSAGDTVTVDLINITGGYPIMGDRMAEGKGEALSTSTMEAKIDLATKVVDAGGKMTQQRTVHNLRGLAMANLQGWFGRFHDQSILVHCAGARGQQMGVDWVIPLQSHADFAEIMVNSVKAPTYNRHFVADGAAIVQGGAQLASLGTDDTMKLEHLDALATLIADSEFKLQPVKLPDDPAAEDEPMYVMYVTHRQWNSVLTNTSNLVWRTFLQNAWNRASYGSKHPLFTGETGMWRNIVMKKMDRAIRFAGSTTTKHITSANRYTATETDVTIAALNATTACDRALLFGAQALAHIYGRSQNSDTYASWMERPYNFGRNLEVAGDFMGGKSKVRFEIPDGAGNNEPTDHGVIVLDTAVSLA